jgi:hypothetical protein
MVEHARDDFREVMLTMEGRIARLPQAERAAIGEISRMCEDQKKQLAQEQARTRQADIRVEQNRLTGERGGPALRPPSFGRAESFQQFSARMEKQAERNVDFNNGQDIAKLEDQKRKDIEQRVEQAEKRAAEQEKERNRAEELAKAAERAREIQERSRGGHNRGR